VKIIPSQRFRFFLKENNTMIEDRSEDRSEGRSEDRSEGRSGRTPEKVFEKILVALDLTDTNETVFEKAIALAAATQSRLMLLHVLSGTPDGGPALPVAATGDYYAVMSDRAWSHYQTQWQEYEKSGLKTLQRYAQWASDAGVSTEFTQSGSHPGRTICELAKTWEADTIIVGSHGRKGLSELLVGSVSNYVMHHAPCSVLVVNINHRTALKTPLNELVTAEAY
jgi:nucleotide-binding universal stress UspA family protein